ncbi:MAG: hypothetical protein GF364_00315 [Candidatus Lokiarchaeota archaeon]|nr:hypothetical protein [Candidatus Lokiarchaeota archaeon]
MLKNKRELIGKVATFLIVNILTPIVIFLTLTTTEYALPFSMIFQILLVESASVGFCWITTYYILRNKIEDRKKLGSYMFLNGFPNVMIYGIPIVIAFFNETLIVIPVIFASGALFLRGTLGMYIGEKFGADISLSFKDTIKRLFTFPPLLGIIAGVIAMNLDFNTSILISIKDILSPFYSGLGAVLIGLILSKIAANEIKLYSKDILIVAIWRFLLSFVFFLCVVFLLHFPTDQTEIRTILLIAVIGPPAVMNVSFAMYFKLDEKFAAMSVATITLVALILLPIIIYFGTNFF